MVADDPESFADLDGHDGNNNPPSQDGTPCTQPSSFGSCSEQQKEEARVDQVASQNQAEADRQKAQANATQQQPQQQSGAQRWEAQQQVTPEKMANTLKQAGQMGDAGVKAGLVVVGAEATVAAGIVAAPTVAATTGQVASAVNTATTSAYVQATTALSAAGTAIGNAYQAARNFTVQQAVNIDTMTSGGGALGKARDFVQAALSDRTPPAPNKYGAAGLVVKAVRKLLFP